MFPPVDKKSFPDRELDVLRFWREHDTYHKSLEARAGAPPFVFYEGPPTANGMPHPGHCLTRAVKDLFPRYKTMRGYLCERKAGWDTHGLPVETEVAKDLTKELGRPVHSKEDIEAYGIEKFIHRCQASVWRYMQQWQNLTERIGFWVDLQNAYVTYHQSYVESVWWSLKQLFERGLLYKGHKIVWWWAQGGTALSSGEVGQGYRQVADPSVYVKFPMVNDDGDVLDLSFLVWTTTPWTLPSNQFLAVNPLITYAEVLDRTSGERLLLARDLVEQASSKTKRDLEVVALHEGSTLVGARYLPPFDVYFRSLGDRGARIRGVSDDTSATSSTHGIGDAARDAYLADLSPAKREELLDREYDFQLWRVVNASFVTTDSGTGIVHQAPAFGEADFDVLTKERSWFVAGEEPPLLYCVGPDGKFTDEAPEYCRGRWVKECDKDIIRDLKQRGLLFHQEQYLHDYPFCWRAEEDPLIQYPRESWFIRTTSFRDEMLANNSQINWMPDHIKEGRFGKFLESNVDWALSRERFWGTPLPIWVCSETGKMEAVASYEELLAKPGVAGTEVWDSAKQANPELIDDLKVHKPYIDAVTYDSPFAKGARMERVSEVIDCWYDSGAMPFAQWGYPKGEGGGGNGEGSAASHFKNQFPADFISEAIDQTRGWFYSQLAISTMLWGDEARGASSEARVPESTRASRLATRAFPHPFRNCIVLGLMLGEDGQKMSKSKRNYREPNEIFDKYGADALRWYFFANQPPWTSIRYSEQAIKDSVPEFLLRLWNVYSFFTIYANIDGFDPAVEVGGPGSGDRGQGTRSTAGASSNPLPSAPLKEEGTGSGAEASLDAEAFAGAKSYRPVKERSELDRWILSELHRTCAHVVARMDQYDNFAACAQIIEFVDALSNWYVRRSRDRFWAADKRSADKLDAYWTLYECLVTTAKLVAPFTPFLAESLWQNLAVGGFGGGEGEAPAEPSSKAAARREPRPPVWESVHLAEYPTGDAAAIDEQLSERMNLVRHISSLGRQARTAANLKVRQPLARVEVILADTAHQAWLEQHCDVIADELNVKQVEFSDQPDKYVTHEVLPNFKLLGPKLGKLLPKVKQWLGKQTGAELLANIRDNGQIDLEIDGQQLALTRDEVEVRIQAKPGWAAANDQGVVVVLATELTEELVAEGLARDLVRVIQDRRKELGCEFTDRIAVSLESEAKPLATAVTQFGEYIATETLADSVEVTSGGTGEPTEVDVAGHKAKLRLSIVK